MARTRMTLALRGPLVAVTAAALTFTASGVAHAAPAAKALADVAVDLSADPPVVGTGYGTTVTATVRNQGDRPARDLQLKITVPTGFELFGTSSSSALPCTPAAQVVTCTGTADLAAHATEYPITLSLEAMAPPGTDADFDASVTTTSRESDTSNNTATRTVQIVGVGTVQGNVWNDLNGDGQREPGEPPLNDISSIQVINPDDGDGSGVSNIFDGYYSFWDVRATRNIVRVTLNGSGPWTFTTPNVGDDATDSDISDVSETGSVIIGDSAEFNVTAGGVVTIDVGLVAKSQ
ncbi:hypothetical protein GCM10023191_097490 [Actinoallomurus oryzae]|uniref:DUF11 domain-containing protein n=1 Tax=Actinoallomurus oryzae TaxID=502180 RepID=A0ABP8R899_9ACTN